MISLRKLIIACIDTFPTRLSDMQDVHESLAALCRLHGAPEDSEKIRRNRELRYRLQQMEFAEQLGSCGF